MYQFERRLREEGRRSIAGIDEAGRGPLAGPVLAAAVVLDPDHPIEGLDDSKKISPRRRGELFEIIGRYARAVAVSAAGPREIERINILRASLRAMATAVARLAVPVDYLLIDGNQALPLDLPQAPIVSGDSLCASIAAASIVAKVLRDRLMERMDRRFPRYGFARHKGYPTREHIAALRLHGPCYLHRRTYSGVTTSPGH